MNRELFSELLASTMWLLAFLVCANLFDAQVQSSSLYDFDLPEAHVKYYLHRRRDLANACRHDFDCPYRSLLDNNLTQCWGYEPGCKLDKRSYSWNHLKCSDKETPWAKTMADKKRAFWEQADFGYISDRSRTMAPICSADNEEEDTSLVCTKFLEYCYAKNVFFHFKSARIQHSQDRYRQDVIGEGEVGGRCTLNSDHLHRLTNRSGFLQGWYSEFKYFQSVDHFAVDNDHCDVIFHRPTIVIKLDAGVSMYHHFCDFINLYASQHLNGSFDLDVDVVVWHTIPYDYVDLFKETWQAFTERPLVMLHKLDGKRVCFRQAMFPLLARMFFGLYFNMPLISVCHGSGLAHAFSKHLIHRLRISQDGPSLDKIRVTFLNRKTHYRRVLNTDEIIARLRTVKQFDVRVVEYEYGLLPFLEQVKITHNSDIFMGVHGSGLTHLFFLPDWAAVFEIYHCEDPDCYRELASIRGVKFFSWQRSDLVVYENATVQNKKFTNFWLDVDEFMRIALLAARYVREHSAFTEARRRVRAERNSEL